MSIRRISLSVKWLEPNSVRRETFPGICCHDDVIKWKHFPRYWPFVREINRSPVNSPHKGQWRGAFVFSLISAWLSGWINNPEAGDLRRHHGHCDVTIMTSQGSCIRFALCFISWVIVPVDFIHILQGYFTGAGAIITGSAKLKNMQIGFSIRIQHDQMI